MAGEGKRIGPYEILGELGRGGMGVVFKARDVSLNRLVALKVLAQHLAQDKSFIKRFLQEARTAAQLSHPNVVTVFQVGREGNFPFIAMEYVKGRDLSDVIAEKGQIDLKTALDVTRKVASALGAAHELKIIHRDIKPQNILVAKGGIVKVMDFGLAKMMEQATALTQAGSVLGTPAYMSPEQCRADDVDHRADLYCLGVVLYQMLAGRLPFQGQTPLVVIHSILTEPPPPIREFNPGVPDNVVAILDSLLAKDREDRYFSAADLEIDLKAAAGGASGVVSAVSAKPKPDKGDQEMAWFESVVEKAPAMPVKTDSEVKAARRGFSPGLPGGLTMSPAVMIGMVVVLLGLLVAGMTAAILTSGSFQTGIGTLPFSAKILAVGSALLVGGVGFGLTLRIAASMISKKNLMPWAKISLGAEGGLVTTFLIL
ncbi:serine/threonine protein kinase, partial [Candidatus Sumerlaeota bacterium]|nr:serine/threonine protein kinase [Candidatus Sumerlaeota bacterium]